MNQITHIQALKFIGNCLADPSLKLSQKDHLTAIECYKILKELIEPVKEESGLKIVTEEKV